MSFQVYPKALEATNFSTDLIWALICPEKEMLHSLAVESISHSHLQVRNHTNNSFEIMSVDIIQRIDMETITSTHSDDTGKFYVIVYNVFLIAVVVWINFRTMLYVQY